VIRRHYFLFAAVAAIVLLLVVVAVKLLANKAGDGAAGGGAPAAAAGPGGGAGGAGGGAAGGARRPGGGRVQMIDVSTVVANPQAFADRIEVLGVAKGRQSVTITSKNAELITAVRFRDGDRVRQGQVLVDLQGTEQDAAIDQAESVAGLAKLNADRWTTLEQKGIASKAQADQYRAVYEQARASLAAARSRRLDRVIRAPFAGVVGLSDVAPGALISPGAVIATLDDVSVIRVDFDIPDRYLPVLRDGTAIVATADSYPTERFAGTIAKLDSRINERTRTIKARALLNNNGGRLKPGMLMRIGIEESVRQALVAPESAVQFDDTQSYVFVVTKREDGQTISTKRPVVVGTRDRGFIEIKAGLRPGEVLVADGINRLQPITPVRVANGEAPAAGAGRGPGAGRPGGAGAPGGAAAAQGGAQFKGGAAGGPPGSGAGAGAGRRSQEAQP
jgi:membrane fusion protein (multidrug efflux system)